MWLNHNFNTNNSIILKKTYMHILSNIEPNYIITKIIITSCENVVVITSYFILNLSFVLSEFDFNKKNMIEKFKHVYCGVPFMDIV